MQNLFEYATSPLNPALKFIIFLVFVVVTGLYYGGTTEHGGKIRPFIMLLFISSLFFATASLLRYFGHGIDFGFTKEFSLKWFQSLTFVVGAVFFIFAAKNLSGFMKAGAINSSNQGLLSIFRGLLKR